VRVHARGHGSRAPGGRRERGAHGGRRGRRGARVRGRGARGRRVASLPVQEMERPAPLDRLAVLGALPPGPAARGSVRIPVVPSESEGVTYVC